MNGILMDVKRMAVHDGPGIRTTLFLKGCPLRCLWCHNPEGQLCKPQTAFYENKCIGCGECEKACPQNIGVGYPDTKACTACGKCAGVCPIGARKLYGKTVSVEEALEIALEDRIFFGEKGGVTLSGGEPLMQAEFALGLLAKLKQAGVNTALDTSGYVPGNIIERSLGVCDLYLYDLKHIDTDEHKKLTGVGNEVIISNLEWLSEHNAHIQVRMPVIPGLNDADDVIKREAELLKKVRPEKVKLLPYHTMAHVKFKALSVCDTLPEAVGDPKKRVKEIAEYLISEGIEAYSDD